MIVLENECLRTGFDERGRLVSLCDKRSGGRELIDSPSPFSFLLNLADSNCFENLVFEEAQRISCEYDESRASFRMDGVTADCGAAREPLYLDVSLTLHVRLEGECLVFTAEIDNRTDMRVLDLEYPRIGVIKSLGNGKPALFLPVHPGYLLTDIGGRLSSMEEERDIRTNQTSVSYPGEAMVSTIGIMDYKSCLFLTSEDPEFITCQFKVKGSATDKGAITLSVDRNLCCTRGKTVSAPIRMRLYEGTWHHAAEEYMKWISPFRPPHKVPDWIRNSTGIFLVIMKQQYGYEMWDYSSLPEIYRQAQANGYNSLLLFGWYHTGHDNNYPDLEVSPTLGGENSLKENIKKVQEAGGHVILYYQGHLIDPNSDYYKSGKGKEIRLENIWGNPYVEQYTKAHRSDFLAGYSRKLFMLACPSCPEWVSLMKEKEHWLAGLGADGVLYDQIGGLMPYICFNEKHPHPGGNPARAMSVGQMNLVKELQDESKKISKEFAFMAENFTDIYSAFLDCIHACPNAPGQNGIFPGDDQAATCWPEFLKYVFPEVYLTGRDFNSYGKIRYINYLFLYGFVPEMEIRYREDIMDLYADKYREERLHSIDVLGLRKKYLAYFSRGRYTDVLGITNPVPGKLLARGFDCGDCTLVTLWNDTSETVMPQIEMEGKDLVSFDTAASGPKNAMGELAPQEVAVCIFR